jgi:hypothetical protein
MLSNPALARPAVQPIPPVAIPLTQLLPWAVFAGVLMLFALYVVGCEQGAVSMVGGHYIHEWVHDSRHLLAFPCH